MRCHNIEKSTNIDIENWYEKLPPEIRKPTEKIVTHIIAPEEDKNRPEEVVKEVHNLIPEYPDYHWRHLEPAIREASGKYYKDGDYHAAVVEALKRYINMVLRKFPCDKSAFTMMGKCFGADGKLKVTKKYKRTDGTKFEPDTITNIEEGQKHLSMGVVAGGRNPLSHEEIRHLNDSGLFSERDCLDMLSLLSHLKKRLDDAIESD